MDTSTDYKQHFSKCLYEIAHMRDKFIEMFIYTRYFVPKYSQYSELDHMQLICEGIAYVADTLEIQELNYEYLSLIQCLYHLFRYEDKHDVEKHANNMFKYARHLSIRDAEIKCGNIPPKYDDNIPQYEHINHYLKYDID